ncbi:hypothetical protein SPI_05666 [Niveomyces insectorum RCEF 264]|uniref:Uncharacterized protein n=1 Tax=Niveomyces insectorum RCEF 264 TaxID=1081102 RepID=A0A167TFA8_9HYPO|nr:hypothetical protein SPI_05666 [Niveomyces insectorum RCEF 264]
MAEEEPSHSGLGEAAPDAEAEGNEPEDKPEDKPQQPSAAAGTPATPASLPPSAEMEGPKQSKRKKRAKRKKRPKRLSLGAEGPSTTGEGVEGQPPDDIAELDASVQASGLRQIPSPFLHKEPPPTPPPTEDSLPALPPPPEAPPPATPQPPTEQPQPTPPPPQTPDAPQTPTPTPTPLPLPPAIPPPPATPQLPKGKNEVEPQSESAPDVPQNEEEERDRPHDTTAPAGEQSGSPQALPPGPLDKSAGVGTTDTESRQDGQQDQENGDDTTESEEATEIDYASLYRMLLRVNKALEKELAGSPEARAALAEMPPGPLGRMGLVGRLMRVLQLAAQNDETSGGASTETGPKGEGDAGDVGPPGASAARRKTQKQHVLDDVVGDDGTMGTGVLSSRRHLVAEPVVSMTAKELEDRLQRARFETAPQALQDELAKLKAERDGALSDMKKVTYDLEVAEKDLRELDDENEELRGILQDFVNATTQRGNATEGGDAEGAAGQPDPSSSSLWLPPKRTPQLDRLIEEARALLRRPPLRMRPRRPTPSRAELDQMYVTVRRRPPLGPGMFLGMVDILLSVAALVRNQGANLRTLAFWLLAAHLAPLAGVAKDGVGALWQVLGRLVSALFRRTGGPIGTISTISTIGTLGDNGDNGEAQSLDQPEHPHQQQQQQQHDVPPSAPSPPPFSVIGFLRSPLSRWRTALVSPPWSSARPLSTQAQPTKPSSSPSPLPLFPRDAMAELLVVVFVLFTGIVLYCAIAERWLWLDHNGDAPRTFLHHYVLQYRKDTESCAAHLPSLATVQRRGDPSMPPTPSRPVSPRVASPYHWCICFPTFFDPRFITMRMSYQWRVWCDWVLDLARLVSMWMSWRPREGDV